MRITNQSLLNSILAGMQANGTRLDDLQTRISSGKRVLDPSDDPAATVKILELRTQIGQSQQYSANAEGGIDALEQADDIMVQIDATLQRVRELATAAANGTNSADSYQAQAAELDHIIRGIVDLANTSVEGKYMFSGWATDQKPLTVTEDGSGNVDSISYLATTGPGVDGRLNREIAPGIQVPVNVTVQEMFTHGTNPTTGASIDMLNRLVALRKDITTLSANPADATAQQGVGDFLGDLEIAENALLSTHTDVGARVKRLEAAVTRADALSDGLTKLVSKQEDLDVPKAILELANVEFSYKLSLQMGARVVQPTLLDFLS